MSSVRPSTPATWLAWPTLREVSFGYEATGDTHHAAELARIMTRWGDLFTAELVIELTGQYAGAVRLLVGGEEVGSVPHGAADAYRPVIEALNTGGSAATCRISADEGELAPWLLILGRPAVRPDDAPFLPPVGAGDYVTLAADEAERLDASLNSRAKTKHVFRPAALTVGPGGLGVWLDGMRVGDLSGAYLRVKEAARAGSGAGRFPADLPRGAAERSWPRLQVRGVRTGLKQPTHSGIASGCRRLRRRAETRLQSVSKAHHRASALT